MPAKDIYHSAVRFALTKDGWTILEENYLLKYEEDRLYVDLAAEKIIAATRQERKILVEIIKFYRVLFYERSRASRWTGCIPVWSPSP
ncbi:MAG: element excision factor XisH family protein [Cyanobacteria bacterium P01_G01_bin.54]